MLCFYIYVCVCLIKSDIVRKKKKEFEFKYDKVHYIESNPYETKRENKQTNKPNQTK